MWGIFKVLVDFASSTKIIIEKDEMVLLKYYKLKVYNPQKVICKKLMPMYPRKSSLENNMVIAAIELNS